MKKPSDIKHNKGLEKLISIFDSKAKSKAIFEQEFFLTFLENITSAAQECIGELSYYYESIIACMPGNVYWLDRNCVLLGGNDNLAKMFGLKSRSELVGLTYEQMTKLANWTENQGEVFRQAELEVMAAGKPRFNVDEPPLIVNGKKTYYMSNKVPLYNTKGEIIGVIGISIDITEKKLAQEREKQAIAQAMEQKAKAEAEEELRQAVMILTGSIVHDLRTPISTLGFLGRALKKYLPILVDTYMLAEEANLPTPSIDLAHLDALKENSSDLEVISKEMNEFVNSTLKTLSRTLSGELSTQDLIICSIDKCIDQTIRRYPLTREQREIIKWSRTYNFNFMGNEVLMIRIISNLLKNALYQINEKNKGEIFIETADGGNFNILKFKDTAGDVSQITIEGLFEDFKTTKEEGTGIGLAFCKKIMQEFGGDIDCHLVEGNFIEFRLTFPKLEVDKNSK